MELYFLAIHSYAERTSTTIKRNNVCHHEQFDRISRKVSTHDKFKVDDEFTKKIESETNSILPVVKFVAKHKSLPRFIYVARGTKTFNEWLSDSAMLLGRKGIESSTYVDKVSSIVAEDVMSCNTKKTVYLTGKSLGGSIMLSAKSKIKSKPNVKAVVFSPFVTHPEKYVFNDPNVFVFTSKSDLLTAANFRLSKTEKESLTVDDGYDPRELGQKYRHSVECVYKTAKDSIESCNEESSGGGDLSPHILPMILLTLMAFIPYS